MKTPLKAKRTDFSYHSAVFDYAAIRKVAAPNPFGIEPGEPVKPRWFCNEPKCTRWADGDGSNTGGVCSSYCLCY